MDQAPKLTPKQQAGLDKMLDFERQYQESQQAKGLPSTVPKAATPQDKMWAVYKERFQAPKYLKD